MPEITLQQRNDLPNDEFALESQRKYPVDTRGRAGNAKARAKQMLNAGHISQAEYDKICAKANKVLK